MTLQEINRLAAQKRAVPNRIYIDENNNKYKGTKDGRVVQIYSTTLVVKKAVNLVANDADNGQNSSTRVTVKEVKEVTQKENSDNSDNIELDTILMLISLKI